jgi:outer membrane lipoprotein-sorting protein
MRHSTWGRQAGILLWTLPLMGAGFSSQEIIQKVEQTLSLQKTVRAQFEELYIWKMTGEKQAIKGDFILCGESQFRITTDDQIIVSDGKTLWTYSKPTNRVIVDKIENAENDWLPQKIFLKTSKEYRSRLSGEETIRDRKCYVIEFNAEKDDLYITRIKAWIDQEKWIPCKIEQTDISRNRTIYTLSDVQTGQPVESTTFEFKIPDGAEVIDLQ